MTSVSDKCFVEKWSRSCGLRLSRRRGSVIRENGQGKITQLMSTEQKSEENDGINYAMTSMKRVPDKDTALLRPW